MRRRSPFRSGWCCINWFLGQFGRSRDLNRILLLTPNEGLSRQHLQEFKAAGIEAEIFDKGGRGILPGKAVEILEITKLRDEMGTRPWTWRRSKETTWF